MKTKKIYSVGSRHNEECYNAVLNYSSSSNAIAYLKVNGCRESLIYKNSPDVEEIIISENSYILSPCFAGDFLLRSERVNDEWSLMASKISNGEVEDSFIPFETTGRPYALSAVKCEDFSFIVWEERIGKKTKIKISKIINSDFEEPVEITNGTFNAYDPVCCVGNDGKIYVAFCAFEHGNYRIKIAEVNQQKLSIEKIFDVSNQIDSCVYPSICSRKNGGVWFSYTCFDTPVQDDATYLKHLRFQAQRRFFQTRGTIFSGALIKEKTYAVVAPKDGKSFCGNVANMTVFGTTGAGRSQIIEDEAGRVHIIFRHYSAAQPIDYDYCNKELKPPKSPALRSEKNNHPNISIITLNDKQWDSPICLISRAHVDLPVSVACNGEKIKVAFTEESRTTGGGIGAEWFDDQGQLGVGVIEVPILRKEKPNYELRPYAIHFLQGNSFENPHFKNEKINEYINAIGQTHTHTNLSVCQREYDRDGHLNYRFTQDVQNSDFCGTTDHAYNMWHTEMLITRKLAEYYYFPGKFVSFPAYEWTGSLCGYHRGGPWGHVNPLFLEEEGELDFFTPSDQNCKGSTLDKLRKIYEGKKIIAPPHHVTDAQHPFNFDYFNSDFQPVIELFQDRRGSSEHPNAPGVVNYLHKKDASWAVEQLKKGKIFGFIASADHSGFARAGLLVKELTRSGLYEAFMARRTYATTGIGLLFSFSCNDFPMGSELKTAVARFKIKITAPEKIHSIQILKQGEVEETLSVSAKTFSYDFDVECEKATEFWYCRILFENGEIAWSSPIWIQK